MIQVIPFLVTNPALELHRSSLARSTVSTRSVASGGARRAEVRLWKETINLYASPIVPTVPAYIRQLTENRYLYVSMASWWHFYQDGFTIRTPSDDISTLR